VLLFKTPYDLLDSKDLAPYNKLEYLEKEIEELKEEENHLKWLNKLNPKEKEWLLLQDTGELLNRNTKIQIEVRDHVKRCYLEIRNNVESMDREPVSIMTKYDTTSTTGEEGEGEEAQGT